MQRPDPVFGENGETPLHVVARRWDVPLAERLLPAAPTRCVSARGRTPYAIAELNANRAVADWLLSRGAAGELSPVDRLVSACTRARRTTAADMLAAHAVICATKSDRTLRNAVWCRRPGRFGRDRSITCAGLDPNRGDEEIGKTAFHCAAMAGHADAVRLLLEHGARPVRVTGSSTLPPLVWAAEGARSQGGDEAEYARVGACCWMPVPGSSGIRGRSPLTPFSRQLTSGAAPDGRGQHD